MATTFCTDQPNILEWKWSIYNANELVNVYLDFIWIILSTLLLDSEADLVQLIQPGPK